MKKTCAFLTALAFTPLFALAEDQCTNRPECWPEGSAMHSGLLLAQQQRAAESTLEKRHNELVDLVASSASGTDQRLLAALKAQQVAWLKYRTQECELIGSLTGAGGSWPSTYATRCEANHTEQRRRRVQTAIRCIKNIPAEQREIDQNNCLQQLAPLTNK